MAPWSQNNVNATCQDYNFCAPASSKKWGKRNQTSKKVYCWKWRTLMKITIIELPEIDEDSICSSFSCFLFFPSIFFETGFMDDAVALKQRLQWG